MREVELKSAAADPDQLVALLLAAGATPTFAGRLTDRRYDTADRSLAARDLVLRLRVYDGDSGVRAGLDWKGPTGYEGGYKVREEVTTEVADPVSMARVLGEMGYEVIREIDREIAQYLLFGAVVRVEYYPRMDVLVEVEGAPEAIEAAIVATGLPRQGFSTERLPDFVRKFEVRTGERAAICARELSGDYRFSTTDA